MTEIKTGKIITCCGFINEIITTLNAKLFNPTEQRAMLLVLDVSFVSSNANTICDDCKMKIGKKNKEQFELLSKEREEK